MQPLSRQVTRWRLDGRQNVGFGETGQPVHALEMGTPSRLPDLLGNKRYRRHGGAARARHPQRHASVERIASRSASLSTLRVVLTVSTLVIRRND